jgi:photosystem II stability/assembly factor-like uncharacterized protein
VTWIPQVSGTTDVLNGVVFTDANTGWAVGGSVLVWPFESVILHTTNGGKTWIKQSGNTTDYLMGVSFVDANTGWAVGHSGTILHTTDGGATWSQQSSIRREDNLTAQPL